MINQIAGNFALKAIAQINTRCEFISVEFSEKKIVLYRFSHTQLLFQQFFTTLMLWYRYHCLQSVHLFASNAMAYLWQRLAQEWIEIFNENMELCSRQAIALSLSLIFSRVLTSCIVFRMWLEIEFQNWRQHAKMHVNMAYRQADGKYQRKNEREKLHDTKQFIAKDLSMHAELSDYETIIVAFSMCVRERERWRFHFQTILKTIVIVK